MGLSKLAKSIFGRSEVQNRIAKNAVKMIIGDIVTLYSEFRNYEGLGALFFNVRCPENSHYMTTKELYNDIILAEEQLDSGTKEFLEKLLNVIEKNEDTENAIVVLVEATGLSVMVIDLEVVNESLEKQAEDATRGV